MPNKQPAWVIRDESKRPVHSKYVDQILVTTDQDLANLLYNLYRPEGVFACSSFLPKEGSKTMAMVGQDGASCMATTANRVPKAFTFPIIPARHMGNATCLVLVVAGDNRLQVWTTQDVVGELVPRDCLEVLNMSETEEQLTQYIAGTLEFKYRTPKGEPPNGYTYGLITRTIITYIRALKREKELQ